MKKLKPVLTVLVLAAFVVTCFAQRGDKNITPGQFLGKSFAECEKILGKPKFSQNPSESHATFARYYVSPNKNVVRIVLGSPKTESADFATYQFTKGRYSAVTACQAIEVKASVSSGGGLQVVGKSLTGQWEKGTPQNNHPKEDWLTFHTNEPKMPAFTPPPATKPTAEEPVEPPTISTANGLPTADEIRQSIAPAWSSVAPAPAQYLTETAWAQRTDAYLERIGRAGQATSATGPVATWRMLILFYPNTDTDYKTPKGETAHFTGSLTSPQIQRVQDALTKLSDLVRWHSGGYCDLQVTVETIERPIQSFSGAERIHQYPTSQKDCKQEVDFYNGSDPYDSIIVIYNPGPIPQTLRGLGGGGVRGTDARINYGGDAAWDVTKPSTETLHAFVHEWIHGLDGFFMARGYETEKLHHLGNYRYIATKAGGFWHSPILQGNLIHDGDKRYGHSRAVWMSGSPMHPASLPPCQLTAPLPGAVFPTDTPITLHWAKSKAPSGYRVRCYAADDLAHPFMSQDAQTNVAVLPAGTLKEGNYVWTVQARDREKLSLVGEAFELSIRPTPQVPPLLVVGPLCVPQINGNGAEFRVDAGVSSGSGVLRVEAQLTWPDGRTQSAWLHRRSPNEGETMWSGTFKAFPNSTLKKQICTLRIKAVDQAGRTNAAKECSLMVDPPLRGGNTNILSASAVTIKPLPLFVSSQTETPLLLQTESFGPTTDNFAGNSWAEITCPDGKTEQIALDRRGFDEFNGPRWGWFFFPPNETNKDISWKISYVLKDTSGKLTRSEPQTVWQYHHYTPDELSVPYHTNLLDGAKWMSYFNEGAAGTFHPFAKIGGNDIYSDYAYTLVSTRAGKFEYSTQFYPVVPSLENGRMYTVSFEAKSDRLSEMVVAAEMFNAPYLQTGLPIQTIKLTRQWKRWEFTFTAINGDKGPIKVPDFRRGLIQGTVWVRGVTLKLAVPKE